MCGDMKDYYAVLGLPEQAGKREIKQAFRKLAMKYHPDKNIGKEKWAEGKFKEIGEAYAVLSDDRKKHEYDMMRRVGFAGDRYGAGVPGGGNFGSGQAFRYDFSNPSIIQEMAKMFSGAGLRFDEEFINRMFSGGGGTAFTSSSGPAPDSGQAYRRHSSPQGKPPFYLRFMGKIAGFILKKLLGIRNFGFSGQGRGSDLYQEIVLSPAEAAAGIEKRISYKRGDEKKRLKVKVPPGMVQGMKIKLKGMGLKAAVSGDLYLVVKIRN